MQKGAGNKDGRDLHGFSAQEAHGPAHGVRAAQTDKHNGRGDDVQEGLMGTWERTDMR